MNHKKISFEFEVYDSAEQLSSSDAELLAAAKKVTADAYAPYSQFRVGAVAQLANGLTISGTNQENASYPIGICAERVLLSAASAVYPGIPIQTIAISYHNELGESSHPVSPCGICRQSLVEYQERMKQPIRLILAGEQGNVYIIPDAGLLLPLQFSGADLKGYMVNS